MNLILSRFSHAARMLRRGTARFFPTFVCSVLISLLYIADPAPTSLPWAVYSAVELGLWVALFASVPAHLLSEYRGASHWTARLLEAGFATLSGFLFGALKFAAYQGALRAWGAYFTMASVGFVVLCVAISYILLMDAKNEHALFPSIFGALVYGISLAIILCMLLVGCLSAYEALLGELPDAFLTFILCLTLLVLSVNLFLSQVPRPGDSLSQDNRGSGTFVSVLAAIYLLLLAILLVYVGKIIVTRTMPVGVMNWYASLALLSYLALWMTGAPQQESAVCRFYARFGGAALLPVIAVQVYGIGVRFFAYGLTSARYLSMVCLTLGVVALVFTLLRRSLRPVFIAAAAAVVVLTVTPLNVIDVPVMEQEARLRGILAQSDMLDGNTMRPGETLTDDAAQGIRSCVLYLKGAPTVRRSAFWRTNFEGKPASDIFNQLGLETTGASTTVRHTYRNESLSEAVPVSGYAWVKAFDNQYLYADNGLSLRVTVPGRGQLAYDLSGHIDAFVKANGDVSNVDIRFELDDHTTLILDYLSVRYDDDILNRCSLSGLLLIGE